MVYITNPYSTLSITEIDIISRSEENYVEIYVSIIADQFKYFLTRKPQL